MADIYVWSGATGAGSGVDWNNAYTKLETATAAKAAGDTFWVAHDHSQTGATLLTITFPGLEGNPNRVYCVDRAGSVPPVGADLRTTAVIATTGANGITLSGSATEVNGITFSVGDGTNNASFTSQGTSRTLRLVNCYIKINNTNTSSRISPTVSGSGYIIWENVAIEFNNTNQNIQAAGRWVWRNTPVNAYNGIVAVNGLISPSQPQCIVLLEGLDLSNYAPNKTLFPASGSQNAFWVVKDCKFGTGLQVTSTSASAYSNPVLMSIRSDASDTTYRSEMWNAIGNQQTSISVIRTGGASDGSQVISWQISTGTLARWEMPFECVPITVWNDLIGSPRTVTIQGIWGTATVPKNDDIFIDVLYFGTAGSTVTSKISSSKANGLATNADIPAGTGTWSGGQSAKFAMSVTFTAQKKGPITIYVKAAKTSSTFYIDPKPVIT